MSPSPCSYHQKETAVATSSASRALAMRLRSSVRCAMRVVACGSRGALRRHRHTPRPASLTVVLPGEWGSARTVDRAGLLGAGTQLGGAELRRPGLVLVLGGQVGVLGQRGGELARAGVTVAASCRRRRRSSCPSSRP